MSECTQCRAPIVFARLPNSRYVALDPCPDDTGLYALLDGNRAIQLDYEQREKATAEVRSRLHRLHRDVCDQYADVNDALTARRVNRWREHVRQSKLGRERNR